MVFARVPEARIEKRGPVTLAIKGSIYRDTVVGKRKRDHDTIRWCSLCYFYGYPKLKKSVKPGKRGVNTGARFARAKRSRFAREHRISSRASRILHSREVTRHALARFARSLHHIRTDSTLDPGGINSPLRDSPPFGLRLRHFGGVWVAPPLAVGQTPSIPH
jgi:hypothetical protein